MSSDVSQMSSDDSQDSRMAEPFFSEDPRDSRSTYASTVSELAKGRGEGEGEGDEVVAERQEVFASSAIPSNPATFADLFPSGRRLLIHHDDSTVDGNLNLRVDTLLSRRDRASPLQEVTLFHLRMHDLHSRAFSFRRYCRDSGREVCHARRLTHSPRPASRRSWTSLLHGLRSGEKAGSDRSGADRTAGFLHRRSLPTSPPPQEPFDETPTTKHEKLTNTMLLEFCNYAHVELARGSGVTASKRYDFEYWSMRFQWRRETRREASAGGDQKEVSFHLVNVETGRSVAYIVPEILTPMEQMDEEGRGGWVPKCSMWISEASVYERMSDVADVIVATGLLVLVDDSIRRRWHRRHVLKFWPKSVRSVRSVKSMNMESFTARVIDELRRGSA